MGEGEKWEESILFLDHLFILENSIQMHLQENSMMLPAISSRYRELSAQEPSMGLQKDQLLNQHENKNMSLFTVTVTSDSSLNHLGLQG